MSMTWDTGITRYNSCCDIIDGLIKEKNQLLNNVDIGKNITQLRDEFLYIRKVFEGVHNGLLQLASNNAAQLKKENEAFKEDVDAIDQSVDALNLQIKLRQSLEAQKRANTLVKVYQNGARNEPWHVFAPGVFTDVEDAALNPDTGDEIEMTDLVQWETYLTNILAELRDLIDQIKKLTPGSTVFVEEKETWVDKIGNTIQNLASTIQEKAKRVPLPLGGTPPPSLDPTGAAADAAADGGAAAAPPTGKGPPPAPDANRRRVGAVGAVPKQLVALNNDTNVADDKLVIQAQIAQMQTNQQQQGGNQGNRKDTGQWYWRKPDLPSFDGSSRNAYITFKRDFQKFIQPLYDDEDQRLHVLKKSLKGQALEKVKHLVAAPTVTFDLLFEKLDRHYLDQGAIIQTVLDDIAACKPASRYDYTAIQRVLDVYEDCYLQLQACDMENALTSSDISKM